METQNPQTQDLDVANENPRGNETQAEIKIRRLEWPPIQVWIVSAIWIALGVNLFCSAIWRLTYSKEITLDQTLVVGVLFVLLGRHLMMGGKRSKSWSIGLSVFLLVALPFNFGVILFYGGSMDYAWPDYVFTLGVVFVLGTVAFYMIYALRHSEVMAWFEQEDHDQQLAKNFTWGLIPIVFIMTMLFEFNQFWNHRSVEDPFFVDVTLTLVDKETKLPTRSMSGVDFEQGWNQPFGYGLQKAESGLNENGMYVRIKGMSVKPVRIKVGAEGFENSEIKLDKETEGEMIIELDRSPDFRASEHLQSKSLPQTHP